MPKSPELIEKSAELRKVLGPRLREARKRARLKVDDVTDWVEASRSNVHGWESGKYFPGVERLVVLAEAYSVSVDWLLGLKQTATGDPAADRLMELWEVLPEEAKGLLLNIAQYMHEQGSRGVLNAQGGWPQSPAARLPRQ